MGCRTSLINHFNEKPILVTLWGSDVFFNDIEGWDNVKKSVIDTAKQFTLEYKFIKTNFRKFINAGAITRFVRTIAKGNWKGIWWHDFQHGIGIISHAVPIAYIYRSKIIYIASTFTFSVKTMCASDPTINDYVRIAHTKVVTDGCVFSRQDKIRNICDFSDKYPDKKNYLRVCWQSSSGQNCNMCEKCYRTIMGILAEGNDPNDYGFIYNKVLGRKIKNDILFKMKMGLAQNILWQDIKNRFLQKPDSISKYPELKWILDINFENINKNLIRHIYFFVKRLMNKIKRIIKTF